MNFPLNGTADNTNVTIWPTVIPPWNPKPWPWNPPYDPWPWDQHPQPWITPLPTPSTPMKPRAPVNRKPAKPRAKVTHRHGKGEKETFITLILDKSGSMQSSWQAALDAINEQIQTIKENAEKGGKTYVSLLLFSDSIDIVFENVLASEVSSLEPADYRIGGSTALRDAMTTAIDLMAEKQAAHKNQGFLTVLISDGQENASGVTKEALKSRMDELEKTDKWTFTYMLDGHTWESIQGMTYYANNSVSNIACYNSTPTGTYTGGQMLKSKVADYLVMRNAGQMSTKNFMGQDSADVTGITPTTK